MKHLLIGALVPASCLLAALPAAAWDGFDADSTELVEIIPDALPVEGENVDVRDYTTDQTTTCLVKAVTRNSRTVEVVVRTPEGGTRTLVMEGR
ncbi:DUF5334 family protein [uncultured Desulfovibrio sp.]|uniref:DUF5334 family protein n=1 Tax=uncultured Desulfovibrio sp. TaxID=167968 RepID=UPI0026211B7B|nr:DUF5334 family protein [uncultured Desulfovibrio sp.]